MKTIMKSARGLFLTTGWGAIAAAVAMMALPADAVAQNRGGERAEQWQRGQQTASPSGGHSRRDSNQGVRMQVRPAQRAQQGRQPQQVHQPQQVRQVQQARQAQQVQRVQPNRQTQRIDNRNDNRSPNRAVRADQRNDRVDRRDRVEQRNDWRSRDQRADAVRNRQQPDWNRNARNLNDARRQAYRDQSRRNQSRWDRDWRRDSRYDWQNYRQHNRNVYRVSRYYAPYPDYSYRRLGVGFSLNSLLYSDRYWINDPWQYRLPAVHGPYRWVRYYDDVLLVDTYSGEVVDVIYDFFW